MTKRSQPVECFTHFQESIETFSLPERFTFPFYYQPHPLCELASKELQTYLEQQTLWHHDFNESGKMFGVLLVQNSCGEIGYLSAFSGKLANKTVLDNFVPPVDDSTNAEFFLQEQKVINDLNQELSALISAPELQIQKDQLNSIKLEASEAISQAQQQAATNKKLRKVKRKQAETTLCPDEFTLLKETLAKESVADKNDIKYLKLAWQEKIELVEKSLQQLTTAITDIKIQRATLSSTLQKKLFAQYRFVNINHEEKNLSDIFENTAFHQKYGVPPAGAGDCAAPKLLQYAFKNQLNPLAMAEFWWGKAPKSEVRQHKNYYTACIGKCQPILTHMLEGMLVDENPMLAEAKQSNNIEVIYQDEHIAIIDKPYNLLSVPGKEIKESVYSQAKELFPQAQGPLIVHRLDMSTSGIMVLALTKQANKELQRQFIQREITKRYVALLSGPVEALKGHLNGEITLPLTGDYDDRPRQMVCFDEGKEAHTLWQLATGLNHSLEDKSLIPVHLYPKTGRTHQLRVHCAHHLGLNMPILGDDLYGSPDERLYLHAEELNLKHPYSKQTLKFIAPAKF